LNYPVHISTGVELTQINAPIYVTTAWGMQGTFTCAQPSHTSQSEYKNLEQIQQLLSIHILDCIVLYSRTAKSRH
jgi:hypothetical protein